MKHIVGAFATLFVLLLHIFLCVAIANVSGAVTEAKEFKADVIAEIENSNFNQNVMNACMNQAKEAGYSLSITNCIYDEKQDIQMAEVVLTYRYEIPLLGISEVVSTRGMAR